MLELKLHLLLFSKKADMNLRLLGLISPLGCEAVKLSQYMTLQRSVQSPPPCPERCPTRPSPHCPPSILPH